MRTQIRQSPCRVSTGLDSKLNPRAARAPELPLP
jgi:hypothetical protein